MKNIDRILLLALFSGYVLKIAVLGATYPDAAIILVLAATHFLYNSQIQNKQIDELKQDLTSIKSTIEVLKKDNEDMRNSVAGVKITQGLRNVR